MCLVGLIDVYHDGISESVSVCVCMEVRAWRSAWHAARPGSVE